MGVRITALAAAAIAIPLAGAAQTRQPVPPRPLSQWYVEASRGILDLTEADAVRLEQRLTANPEDLAARLKLMEYHQRADRAGRAEDREKRARLTLWLVERHPDSEILHSPAARFAPGELTEAQYRRATALWEAAAKARPRDAAMAWNAASFFEGLDPGLYMSYLEATAAADPNHPFALRPLADLYALSILNGGPLAARARAGLEASRNVWVLGNAAYMLQSQYNLGLQRGMPDPNAAALAERYFLRAKAIDPHLDRNAILPQLDMAAVKRAWRAAEQAQNDWQARAAQAVGRIRRLPVQAFPQLPVAVAGVLRARGCTVPQPSPEGAPRNVIRGEFFTRGEPGWAVLCSTGGSTALLVFRNDRDTHPSTVKTSDDLAYVQDLGGGRIGYSHEITPAGRDFILRHYRAYGGPEPPPIDHQGIDDAFLEKASVTWYFYQGSWRTLQGAD